MVKPLVWSNRAVKDLVLLKEYFDQRNRSTLYSTKLLKAFKACSHFIAKYPMASMPTTDEHVRGFIILHYIIFFQVFEQNILVLAVWDGRKSGAQFKNILKSI